MTTYTYIGQEPLDFICKGVPSYLSYGMNIKHMLVEYMLSHHPKDVKVNNTEITNIHPLIHSSVPEPSPEIKVPDKPINKLILPDTPFIDNSITPEFEKIFDNAVIPKTITPVVTTDISKLINRASVLELYRDQLVEVCTNLELSVEGKKSELVSRICEKLGITK